MTAKSAKKYEICGVCLAAPQKITTFAGMKAATSAPSPHPLQLRPPHYSSTAGHAPRTARRQQNPLTMKRILLTLVAVVTLAVGSAKALSYVQA